MDKCGIQEAFPSFFRGHGAEMKMRMKMKTKVRKELREEGDLFVFCPLPTHARTHACRSLKSPPPGPALSVLLAMDMRFGFCFYLFSV